MNRLRQILKDRRGVAFPLIIAIVLVLVPGRRFPIGLGTLDYTGRAAGHDHRCGCIRPRISTGHHPL